MAAAKRLGFLGSGLAFVEVEVLTYPKRYVAQEAWREARAPALNSD